MKRTLFLIAALLSALFTISAQTILNPRVDSQYRSEFGTMDIIGIEMSEDATYVVIEDITPRHTDGLWISFSDKTTISYSNRSAKILAWGVMIDDELEELKLNHKYSLTGDRRYVFVLAFPHIPSYIETVSIRENVSGGFYWNGINLKNSADGGRHSGNGLSDNSGNRGGDTEHFSPTGSGTCFAINNEGYIATCYHVVEGSTQFRIRGIGNDFNKLYKARLVAVNKMNDLAILKIDDSSFHGFGNIPYRITYRTADVGESIFVLGYPLRPIMGNEIKLTDGLISSLSGYQGDKNTYQISAAVQMGNSGGPLFDKNGDVIGIVNARLYVESAAYAVKGKYLNFLSTDNDISLNETNSIRNLSLAEQIKKLKQYVFIIEVE